MAIVIDGEALTVTLSPGQTSVDVKTDLFEPWKDWLLSNPKNRGYPKLFRSSGGDPLNAVINQGSYFFLNNVAGWRLKPPEEDITVYLTGNLAVESSDFPAFKPTDGNFTAAILGLQPVTQGVTPTLVDTVYHLSFSDGIWIDQANGYTSATVPEQDLLGSSRYPTLTVGDAKLARENQRVPKRLYVIGNLDIGNADNLQSWDVQGQNAFRTQVNVDDLANVSGTAFNECNMHNSTLDGNSILRESVLSDTTFVNGYVFQCYLVGTTVLGGGAQGDFMNCYSGVAGVDTPIMDLGGSGQNLAMRAYTGGIKLINKTGADDCSIDFSSGQLKIDLTTVTGGTIVARGNGKVIDAATGEHMPSGVYGGLTLVNETLHGVQLQELWALQGLDKQNPLTVTPTSRDADGITQTIVGDPATSVVVTRT